MSDETATSESGTMGATDYALAVRSLSLVADPRLSPAERRAQVPRWWDPLLLCSPDASRRLRRWVDRGRHNIDNTEGARAELIEDTIIIADEPERELIVQALHRLPPAVLAHVSANVCIISVGGTVAGRQLAPMFKAGADEAQLVLVDHSTGMDPESFLAVVGHELGHAWAEPAPIVLPIAEGVVALSGALLPDGALQDVAAHREALLATGVVVGRLEDAIRPRVHAEVLAARLAASWGFRGHPANPDSTRAATRARADDEARVALERMRGEP